MSAKPQLRFRKRDEIALKKAIKNFNAKTTRLNKKWDSASDRRAIPDKVKYKDIRSKLTTRDDFNRELASLQAFTQRNAEKLMELPDNELGTKITEWEYNDFLARKEIIDKKRAEQFEYIQNVPVLDRGKETGYTRGEERLNKSIQSQFEPVTLFKADTRNADIKERRKLLVNESSDGYWSKQDLHARENYIKAIRNHLYGPEIDPLVDEIVEAINDKSVDEFRDLFLGSETGKYFEVPYALDDKEIKQAVEKLMATWSPKSNRPQIKKEKQTQPKRKTTKKAKRQTKNKKGK